MSQSGEAYGPEQRDPTVEVEYQQEVLAFIQAAHSLRLREAGTIDRALAALPDHHRESIGAQPTAWVNAFYDPKSQLWRTGLTFPIYRISDEGKVTLSSWFAVPLCEGAEGAEPILPDWMAEYFTDSDAHLVTALRQELVDARGNGSLSLLGCDLTRIDDIR